MATIVDGKNRIPFMRGMLIHFLIQRGFTHGEAAEVANAARDALSKEKNVRRKDIVRLIRDLVKERWENRDVGDLVFWERLPTSVSVERGGTSRPFSKEILAHSVQVTGVPRDAAYEVAATVESRLIDQRRQSVAHDDLFDLVIEHLQEHFSDEHAERYWVWRVWRNMDRPLVILIGGATGVGKTTLAIGLANLLDIPRVVATDDIRQIMRLMLSADLLPALHPSSYAAGEAIPEPLVTEEDPVIAGYHEQARIVSVGVRAIISRCIEENASVIIDGVHLLPDLIDPEPYADTALLVPLNLSVADRAALEARFKDRADGAPSRGKRKYMSHLDAILRIQEDVLNSSTKHGIPVIDTGATDELMSAAAMVIVEQLQAQPQVQKAMVRSAKERKKRG